MIVENPTPSVRPLVDAGAEFLNLSTVRTPEAAADERLFRLAVDVVAGVWALATCARPCGGEVRLRFVSLGHKESEPSDLVGCWILAETDIPMDAKREVLNREFGDSLVSINDGF